MKRRPSQPTGARHALLAFVAAVALAFAASATQLLPDITAQSVDALPALPDGLDRALAASGIE
ncbi:MAG: hypothetical protein M9919_02695 [Burkholderiaceae bacterium]|jgi:hypothetical protein|nr:hypothetical protein [Burkholderiaceae bacterium]MCO5102894.1 hypothetical protein [Burkholderiaceae bacterium]